jgi:hypothetical protein
MSNPKKARRIRTLRLLVRRNLGASPAGERAVVNRGSAMDRAKVVSRIQVTRFMRTQEVRPRKSRKRPWLFPVTLSHSGQQIAILCAVRGHFLGDQSVMQRTNLLIDSRSIRIHLHNHVARATPGIVYPHQLKSFQRSQRHQAKMALKFVGTTFALQPV